MSNDVLIFGKCAELLRKTVQPKEAFALPYIGLEHIGEGILHLNGYGLASDITSTKFMFRKGDILFGKLRPYFRKVIRAPFSGICSTDIWVIKPLGEIDQGFLFYWVASQGFVDFSMKGSEGTRMPRAKWEHVSKHEIPAFSVSEQRTIAHILGTLDDKIELNRRMNETLEAMAQAIFKSWFLDFDPVRAKMEGRPTGLPKEIADLFPDSFEDSELGEIPRGWKHLQFGQLLEDTIGGDWGKEYPEGDFDQPISIIRGTDLPDLASGFVGKAPTRFTTKKKLVSRLLQHGDIVVEVSGGSPTQPTGSSLYISSSMLKRFEHPVVCASFCRRFRPINGSLGVLAAFHLTNLYYEGGTWEYQNQSTGIANFQTNHFLEAEKVLVPCEKVLGAFIHFVEPLIAKMAANENLTLSEFRDILLPKLLSGEIRVSDPEKFLEFVNVK